MNFIYMIILSIHINIMELSSKNFVYKLQGDMMNIPSNKILIAMVGLPGLGKSYFSKNLKRNYTKLNKQLNVKVFNAGEKRRVKKGEKQNAEWFKKQQKYKEQIAMDTLSDSINWLNKTKIIIVLYLMQLIVH